jgi:hypothetical protein
MASDAKSYLRVDSWSNELVVRESPASENRIRWARKQQRESELLEAATSQRAREDIANW